MVSASAARINYNDDDRIGSQEIADYLGVSKPYAINLIRSGKIIGGRLGRGFQAYFKYVKEYENKLFHGEDIQSSLPLKDNVEDKDRTLNLTVNQNKEKKKKKSVKKRSNKNKS